MSVSVLTEHANRSDALAGLPLRADQARPMSELGPVLATPTIVGAATAIATSPAVGVAVFGWATPVAAGSEQPQ